jgi:hypothetical protein
MEDHRTPPPSAEQPPPTVSETLAGGSGGEERLREADATESRDPSHQEPVKKPEH